MQKNNEEFISKKEFKEEINKLRRKIIKHNWFNSFLSVLGHIILIYLIHLIITG
ncbi:MAG: hypothetical protein ACLFPJ_04145 [Candidatus Woesearchaeota archaeon]